MRERGLTLLELLVTLTIIGIVVGTTVLSLAPRGNQRADIETERLDALFRMAQDEARLTSRTVVWIAGKDGYHFEYLHPEETHPLRAELLAQRRWQLPLTDVRPDRIAFGMEPIRDPVDIALTGAQGELRLHLDALGRTGRVP